MERYSPAQWETIKRALGPERAAYWLSGGQLEIGDAPAVTGALASATPPQGALQGETTMDENEDQTAGVTGALDLAGSAANLPSSRTAAEQAYAKLAAYPEEVARAKAAQFAAGQKYINENYQGPSTSQRLWALSQALLAPRPYKGFAGTMANISQAFGNIGQQQEAAEQKRKEALFQLQQQYGPGSDIEAKGTAYKTAADLAMKQYIADTRAAEAARKGAEPKLDFDTVTGTYRVRPGTGGVPTINADGNYIVSTPEEAANVPIGAQYIFKGNPRAVFVRR